MGIDRFFTNDKPHSYSLSFFEMGVFKLRILFLHYQLYMSIKNVDMLYFWVDLEGVFLYAFSP